MRCSMCRETNREAHFEMALQTLIRKEKNAKENAHFIILCILAQALIAACNQQLNASVLKVDWTWLEPLLVVYLAFPLSSRIISSFGILPPITGWILFILSLFSSLFSLSFSSIFSIVLILHGPIQPKMPSPSRLLSHCVLIQCLRKFEIDHKIALCPLVNDRIPFRTAIYLMRKV